MYGSSKISYPLVFSTGERILTVVALNGGQMFKEKCIKMGIVPGQKIETISVKKSGASVVRVNNTKLILGEGFVHKIYVV